MSKNTVKMITLQKMSNQNFEEKLYKRRGGKGYFTPKIDKKYSTKFFYLSYT